MSVPAAESVSTARAFWITAPGRGEIREEALRAPLPGEVLVRTLWSGISRGTESLVYQGRVPASEYERMRCPHQAGDFPAPVKYGYSNVGQVVAGSAALLGKAVFCLYPHQTAYVVKESDVVPIPNGVPPERAVLAANFETALNAMWDARPLAGDRISIVGGGVVGCLCAYLAKRFPGTDVELVDVRDDRAETARALGVRFATPDSAARERDLVFHASGRPEGVQAALELAATDAAIVELSWFGDQDVLLPLGRAFHASRLTLRSSQVGRVSPQARARFSYRSRLELALALLGDARLDALLGGNAPFEMLPMTFTRISAAAGPLCERVRYP